MAAKAIKEIDPVEALRQLVAEAGSQQAAGKRLGISGPYVHDLLTGSRGFSARMLEELGLKRVVVKQ